MFCLEDDMINTSNSTGTTLKNKILFLPIPLLNYQQHREALVNMNGIDPVKLNEVLQQIARKQQQHNSNNSSESDGTGRQDPEAGRRSSAEGDRKSPFQGKVKFLRMG